MNSSIICNTGPIIALSILGRLSILQNLFNSVIIPEEVHREILEGGETQVGLHDYKKSNWIKVIALNTAVDPLLRSSLDAGEAAVISLARQVNADFVIIDEKKARKIARTVYKLRVIGTVRILIEAKRCGVIDKVGEDLQTLRDSGYWISDSIMDIVLNKAGEK